MQTYLIVASENALKKRQPYIFRLEMRVSNKLPAPRKLQPMFVRGCFSRDFGEHAT